MSGKEVGLLLVDADTRYMWVYFMKQKSDAIDKIKEWVEWMETNGHTAKALTTLRTDGGGEFSGQDLIDFLREKGIKREMSAPYAHVGDVERQIRTVQDTARSMLFAATLSAGFWCEAVATAVYVLNRTINSSSKSKTRFELFFGRKPDISRLRTFGCTAYAKVYDELRSKWEAKAREGIFVGYDDLNEECWRIWHPQTRTITRTKNVIFDETMK